MNEHCLLTLVAAPAIEDALVDWLLAWPGLSGFTSTPVSGHGSSPHSMSVAEQVAGRRRQVLFQCHLSRDQAVDLVAGLQRDFSGSGLHYWLVPIIDAGHLA